MGEAPWIFLGRALDLARQSQTIAPNEAGALAIRQEPRRDHSGIRDSKYVFCISLQDFGYDRLARYTRYTEARVGCVHIVYRRLRQAHKRLIIGDLFLGVKLHPQ